MMNFLSVIQQDAPFTLQLLKRPLYITFKPIFHCDAKALASGPCVGLHPQRDDFALLIPTFWYLKSRKHPMPNLNLLYPTRNQNASQWNIGCVVQNFRVGHVYFMFFVLISLSFGSQRKRSFQWNMGFIV